MKKPQKPNNRKNPNIVWVIGIGASFITLYFNSKIQDPFNAPKMWALFLLSLWILGHFIVNLQTIKFKFIDKNKFLSVFLAIFIVSALIASLLTDVRITAFLGENQRRDGFLTYASLVIFLVATITFIDFTNVNKLLISANFCGWLLAIYGLMQMSGVDFVDWNNPGNAVISTLGNSNFAGAMMAVFAIISFGQIFISSKTILSRLFSALLTLFLTYIIFPTNARQGILVLILGIGLILIVLINNRNQLLGKITIFAGLLISLISILGMLQIGPLQSILYKSSVSVRGFYWRAGIEMFKSNPSFGVGFDRYGAYFKQYRETQYSLNYGFDLTSTNAHNVVIQLFATGGIFVGVAYIAITAYIGLRGIQSIKQNIGEKKIIAVTFFAAWVAFQAQSLISIDNIGITIWGWVLGGVLVAISSNSQEVVDKKARNSIQLLQPIISSALLMVGLLLVIPQFRGESYMFQQRIRFNPQDANLRSTFYDYSTKTINQPLVEPYYKIVTGNYLLSNGYFEQGTNVLEDYLKFDPRNLDALISLARFYENSANIPRANEIRLEIIKYDPWNAINYLQLGRNYKASGDLVNMNIMREKINSFAPKTEVADQANSELSQS
jgi:O-antigen ligase